jgi:hypothetical protein
MFAVKQKLSLIDDIATKIAYYDVGQERRRKYCMMYMPHIKTTYTYRKNKDEILVNKGN